MMRTNGVPDPAPHLEDFRLAAEDALAGLRPTLRATGRALPGAQEVLAELHGDGVVQTLLTGNIRTFAELKMHTFGLAGYLDLDIGAYGWSHVVRANLVDLARAAAHDRHGRDYCGPATVLVGDTPRDVEAALLTGAAVVAVAARRDRADPLRTARAAGGPPCPTHTPPDP